MKKNFYYIEEITKVGNIGLCVLTTFDRDNAHNLLREVLTKRYGSCAVVVTKSCVAYINCKVKFESGVRVKYVMHNFVGYEK